MNWIFTYLTVVHDESQIDTMIYRNQTLFECVYHFQNWPDFKGVRIISIIPFD